MGLLRMSLQGQTGASAADTLKEGAAGGAAVAGEWKLGNQPPFRGR